MQQYTPTESTQRDLVPPTPPRAADGAAARRLPRLRARALVVTGLLVPPTVAYLVWANWRFSGTYPLDALYGPAVAALTILTLLNAALSRWRRRWALSSGEIMVIYAVLATAIGLCGSPWSWGGNTAPTIAYPVAGADSANRWAEDLWPALATWLVVADHGALEGFLTGSSSPYRPGVLRAWIGPASWWIAWIVAVAWVTLCLGVIARRRWSEEEKLPFPLAAVPTHLAELDRGPLRSPLWWVGLGVPMVLGALGLLHTFLPGVPFVRTHFDLSAALSNNPPWDGLRTPVLTCDPWYLGLCYLMPVDLAFSLIVFNVLWRIEYIVARTGGWLTSPWNGPPYGDQQIAGSYLALTVLVLWLDRRYLAQVLRKALGRSSVPDDRGEMLSYRTAVFGGMLGIAFLWWFCVRGGMGGTTALAFIGLLLATFVAMLRVRAQLGPPNHPMYGVTPQYVLTQYPGTRAIGPKGLGLIALLQPFLRQQDTSPASVQLDALRMAERGGIHARSFGLLLMLAIPAIMVCSFWANMHFGYAYGIQADAAPGVSMYSRLTTDSLSIWLRHPSGPDYAGTFSIALGAAITAALMHVKLVFPQWPLHALAFPLAFSWATDYVMPALVVTWLVKVLLLRYGGLRAHQRALPFFLGLIAGSGTAMLVQTVVTRAIIRA